MPYSVVWILCIVKYVCSPVCLVFFSLLLGSNTHFLMTGVFAKFYICSYGYCVRQMFDCNTSAAAAEIHTTQRHLFVDLVIGDRSTEWWKTNVSFWPSIYGPLTLKHTSNWICWRRTGRCSNCRAIRYVLSNYWLNEIKVSDLNAENDDDECNEMSNSEKSKTEWQFIIVVCSK